MMARALPPGQRLHPDHPRFGLPWYAHRAPRGLAPIAVEVVGPAATVTLTAADLVDLGTRHQRSDFHCVTTWSRQDVPWAGVPFATVYREVLAPRVDPAGTATFLTFVGRDGYLDETRLEDLLADDVLLATALDDDTPLSLRHGGPVRLVAPAHYGYKSVKYLTRIELRTRSRRRLAWLPFSSHHPRGRVDREERVLGLPHHATGLFYRYLVLPPTLWWYRRHPRG